ncbi:hypothetical protein ZIOFF_014186 [Zingiber officinale]|uniref:inositol-1,3,4-trisphosphate 5/6-kinase n=1 Tax=Zingiber officinale TaxID=94328 RepID=A0A8J5LPA7_ZINOF|nr:hypothetical protein ZIOFF_014186 [Zingiber officinale]
MAEPSDRRFLAGLPGPVFDLNQLPVEPSDRRFVVGYAFLPKKQQSFIQPSLVGAARDRGVDLVPIDRSRPLVEQDGSVFPLHLTFPRLPNESFSEHLEAAELPPSSFLENIAMGLRQATGLPLFNFDMIRDANVRSHHFIIDINYFPGYPKLPDYEQFMTNFFLDMVYKKGESAAASSFSGTE